MIFCAMPCGIMAIKIRMHYIIVCKSFWLGIFFKNLAFYRVSFCFLGSTFRKIIFLKSQVVFVYIDIIFRWRITAVLRFLFIALFVKYRCLINRLVKPSAAHARKVIIVLLGDDGVPTQIERVHVNTNLDAGLFVQFKFLAIHCIFFLFSFNATVR